MHENFLPSFDTNGVPLMLDWTPEKVGAWVRVTLNFPEYEECFVKNCISGRKLIWIDASHLQKIGVQDFKHIQVCIVFCLFKSYLKNVDETHPRFQGTSLYGYF